MEPLTLILTALGSGATAGLQESAQGAVAEVYTALKERIRALFERREPGQVALEEHEREPAVWAGPLSSELSRAGADRDEELLQLARRLMELLDPDGARGAKYEVTVGGGAQGTVIGDDPRVHQSFHAPPPDLGRS